MINFLYKIYSFVQLSKTAKDIDDVSICVSFIMDHPVVIHVCQNENFSNSCVCVQLMFGLQYLIMKGILISKYKIWYIVLFNLCTRWISADIDLRTYILLFCLMNICYILYNIFMNWAMQEGSFPVYIKLN